MPGLSISISGNVKKKSIFKDIIQIKVDHPPSYPVCIVKLCVCIATALHCSKYTKFLDGMKVAEHETTYLKHNVHECHHVTSARMAEIQTCSNSVG